jgi:hypothetical protein
MFVDPETVNFVKAMTYCGTIVVVTGSTLLSPRIVLA